MKKQTVVRLVWLAGGALLLVSPARLAGQAKQAKPEVVEEIIARVNNEIITGSDYQKAMGSLLQEVEQDCPNCSQDRIQAEVQNRQKNLLRDLIDRALLWSAPRT